MSPETKSTLEAIANGQINFLTAEQGTELASLGYIAVDGNTTDPSNPSAFKVSITDAGKTALGDGNEAQISDISSSIAIPAVKRGSGLRTREEKYPFEKLPEPTQNADGSWNYPSFHVKADSSISSTVSAANRRYSEPVYNADGTPVMEQMEGRELIKDEAGNPVLTAEGKRQFKPVTKTVHKTQPTRKFILRKVDATDPMGEGERVFRVPLDFAS